MNKFYILLFICSINLSSCFYLNEKGNKEKEQALAEKEAKLEEKENELKEKEKRELEQKNKELAEKVAKLEESERNNKTAALPPPPKPETQATTTIAASTSPDVFVASFLRNLGNREFAKAYSKCYMPKAASFNSLDKFSSTRAYGGITKVDITKIQAVSQSVPYAKVYAYYYAEDPYNKNGYYEQYFHLTNYSGTWKITKIETINLQQF